MIHKKERLRQTFEYLLSLDASQASWNFSFLTRSALRALARRLLPRLLHP